LNLSVRELEVRRMKALRLERGAESRRGAVDQRHMVLLGETEPAVESACERLESESVLAFAMDCEGRLLYMSSAFAELVGVDGSEYIGERRPFPWCVPGETEQCMGRCQFLSSQQARDLGICAVSWNVSDAVGKCLRVSMDREALLQCECEISRARCVAVADPAQLESAERNPSQDAIPMGQLAANLRRIALELEQLGMSAGSLSLPLSPDLYPQLRSLSSREWEVLRPLLRGRRVQPIARALCISPHTVRSHLQSIFQKVGVHSQAELIEKLSCSPSARAPDR
jgi:DNA-binding CsgD family transcriptional regulator